MSCFGVNLYFLLVKKCSKLRRTMTQIKICQAKLRMSLMKLQLPLIWFNLLAIWGDAILAVLWNSSIRSRINWVKASSILISHYMKHIVLMGIVLLSVGKGNNEQFIHLLLCTYSIALLFFNLQLLCNDNIWFFSFVLFVCF